MILILDASKSMKDDDGTGRPKFQAAKEALNTLVDELPDDAKVGLRVYGSEVSGTGRAAGCADTKLVSPVAALDRDGAEGADRRAAAARLHADRGLAAGRRRGSRDGEAEDRRARLRRRRQLQAARSVRRREADLQGRHRPQDPGRRLPGQGGRAAPAAVHRQGRGRALRRRDRREGPGRAAARADGAGAAAVHHGRRADRSRAAARGRRSPTHPGATRPSLRPGEAAWYAFEVGAGQAIAVSTTLPASDAGIPTQLRTELQSERMKVKDSDLATNSGDVLTAKMDAQPLAEDFEKPPRGHALVRLEADAAAGQSGPYPIELTVDVTGEVAEERRRLLRREGGAADDGERSPPASRAASRRSSGVALRCGARPASAAGGRREAAGPRRRRGGERAGRGAGRRAVADRGRWLVQRRAGPRARPLRRHAPRRRAAVLRRRAPAGAEREGDAPPSPGAARRATSWTSSSTPRSAEETSRRAERALRPDRRIGGSRLRVGEATADRRAL